MNKAVLLTFLFFLSSCAFTNRSPAGHGFFYTNDSELIYYDPYIKPQQKATFCSKNYLGLASYGDSSFDAIRLSSDIRKISTIERTYYSRFLLYAKSCLIVKGE